MESFELKNTIAKVKKKKKSVSGLKSWMETTKERSCKLENELEISLSEQAEKNRKKNY